MWHRVDAIGAYLKGTASDPLDKFALLPEPHLDLVEHRAPRTPLVGELLLALDVLHDELAVGVVLVDGVELLLPARSISVKSVRTASKSKNKPPTSS